MCYSYLKDYDFVRPFSYLLTTKPCYFQKIRQVSLTTIFYIKLCKTQWSSRRIMLPSGFKWELLMNICFATNHLYIPMLRNIYKKEREDEYIPFQSCSFNQKSKYRFLKTSRPSEKQRLNLHNSKSKFATLCLNKHRWHLMRTFSSVFLSASPCLFANLLFLCCTHYLV